MYIAKFVTSVYDLQVNSFRKMAPWIIVTVVAVLCFLILSVVGSARRTIKRINSDYRKHPYE